MVHIPPHNKYSKTGERYINSATSSNYNGRYSCYTVYVPGSSRSRLIHTLEEAIVLRDKTLMKLNKMPSELIQQFYKEDEQRAQEYLKRLEEIKYK